MKNIWGRFPVNLRKRPFDAYVSLLLFWIGLYQLVDPTWPENYQNNISQTIITIISLYLVFAGLTIFLALIRDPRQSPIFCFFGQMYGWSFMSAATAAITLIIFFNGVTNPIENFYMFFIWLSAWFFITVASIIRSTFLWQSYRNLS